VKAAGGQLTGTYAIQGQLVDPEQKSLVDTLGVQLDKQLSHGTQPGASTYPRIGQLIAIAVANRDTAGGSANDDAVVVRQSLAAAKLLTVPAGHPQTAPLVLVVLGTAVDQAIADGVLSGLSAGARGVVAVAPTRDTTLAGLDADGVTKGVTTVDGSETDAGRVAAVLGLVRAWSTRGGAFGASGADGAVPLG
jgi:Copper transport outer membrane protein, MctB